MSYLTNNQANDYNKNKKIRRVVYMSLFFVLGYIFTVPAFNLGIIVSDDILVHANWHETFSSQLFAGEWYPRWLKDMNGGRGSPAFFYYPPLPYYVSALFEMFLPSKQHPFAALYLSFGFALGLSGVTSFLLLKKYVNEIIAFSLAVFYMLAPYHVFVNFYHRFAYAEFWAFAWTPLLFCAVISAIENNKNAVLGLALSFALIILTHLPTVIIISIPVVVYAVISSKNMDGILRVASGAMLGFLLVAFYAIPMLFYQKHVNLEAMWDGKYLIENNFLAYNVKDIDNYRLYIVIMQFLTIITISYANRKSKDREFLYWATTGFIVILMMFQISSPIWSIVPLLSKIQFPWRLNQLLLLSMVVSCAMYMKNTELIKKEFTVIIFVFVILQIGLSIHQINTCANRELTRDEFDHVEINHITKTDVGEYFPRWVDDKTRHEANNYKLYKTALIASSEGNLDVIVNKWEPRQIEVTTHAKHIGNITITQFYFPNWQARLDGKDVELKPSKEGLLELSVPTGQHYIAINLVKGAAETVGEIVSIITIISILYMRIRKPSCAMHVKNYLHNYNK